MRLCILFMSMFLLNVVSAQALPYYEVRAPSGNYADKTPRGYVMVIHGGGWQGGRGPGDVAKTQYVVDRYTNRGYATINTDYRSGSGGYADVKAVFDKFRASLPSSVNICLYGESAGAHYAQLLAADRNSGVACTVAVAGPADFNRFGLTLGELYALTLFHNSFGYTSQAKTTWSPVNHAQFITKPVLLASAANDRLVVPAQTQFMEDALAGKAERYVVQGGSRSDPYWVHSTVSPFALQSFYSVERAFLARAMPPLKKVKKKTSKRR